MPPLPLRDYQITGIDWLYNALTTGNQRAVLLADEAGLGKTLQALETAHRLRARRVVIVCPAGARRVWHGEIHLWFPDWRDRVFLVEPGTTPGQVHDRVSDMRPLILVVGYDEWSNHDSKIVLALRLKAWDLLILDEAHYLKNPSNRTRAIYGGPRSFAASASRAILLTGTPTPNHAGELYQHCRQFWPQTLPGNGGLSAFEDRYTRYRDTVYGRQVVGSKNQNHLREALKNVVLRRRKDEVLQELPLLIVQDVPLGPVQRLATAHLTPNLTPRCPKDGARKLLNAVSDEDLLRAMRQPDAALASLRQDIGVEKAEAAVDWIRERLASTEKILVFAWHHSVIEILHRLLLEFDPQTIIGATSPAARTAAIERFQRNRETRVFLGQILAAGTAITLTAANEVAIVEPSWVPGENVQAICRAHRLGQRDSVLASFLYLPGTLDERIMRVFRRKAAEIAQLQGDFTDAGQRAFDFRSRDRGRSGGVPAPAAAGPDGGGPGLGF